MLEVLRRSAEGIREDAGAEGLCWLSPAAAASDVVVVARSGRRRLKNDRIAMVI